MNAKAFNRHFPADFRKLTIIMKNLEVFAVVPNRYTIENCRIDKATNRTWETIVVTPRGFTEAQYQLLSKKQWEDIHYSGEPQELARIAQELSDQINSRGW